MGPCSNSEGRDAPFLIVAGAEGFEPPQAGSEPAVLPLDDAPTSGAATLTRRGRPQLYTLQSWGVKLRDAGRTPYRGETAARWILSSNTFTGSFRAHIPTDRNSPMPPSKQP